MALNIQTVAVIGGGTMGSGIAAACAAAGRSVLLFEADAAAAQRALERVLSTAQSPEDKAMLEANTRIGTIADDLPLLAQADWVCEAIIEDVEAKRQLFAKVETVRRDGSVVSSNTSGILLHDIAAVLPERLRRDLVISHFFNPVRLMKCVEIVPGVETRPGAADDLAAFCRDVLGKGVVRAKDTINFIANRIGCFWMLSGLHQAETYLAQGLTIEQIDALMGAPVGFPSTGLYGLFDLIGLDVMDHVGRNMVANLPEGDRGRVIAAFPTAEQAMLERGQLGRKSGGGFYRVSKQADGGKLKEVFDARANLWRKAEPVQLASHHANLAELALSDDVEGRFTWDLMVGTLLYAADLVPAISDDVVNVDRALRWGYNWGKGPFEMLDEIGPTKVIARLERLGQSVPHMLAVLKAAGADRFYGAGTYLGGDGIFHPVPKE